MSDILEPAAGTQPGENRYPELDSLRGLAAFTVVVLHFHDMWWQTLAASGARPARWSLVLRGFYNGPSAVLLFFVLSGFVLSLPLLRGKRQSYPRYALRRVLRIYGPYLGALVIGIAGSALLYSRPHIPGWTETFWTAPPSWQLVLQHLLFLGVYDTTRFDFVIWTLVHELRISLLFPLLFWLVARMRMWSVLPMLAMAAIFVPFASSTSLPPGVAHSLALTCFYMIFFASGILLNMYKGVVKDRWLRASSAVKAVFVTLAFVLYMYPDSFRHLIKTLMSRIFHLQWQNVEGDSVVVGLVALLGAAGLVFLALQWMPLRRLLGTSPLRFLGHISYSLYLVHPVVLLVLSLLLYGKVSPWIQMPLYFGGSILGSWLFCRAVEEPFIRWSRRVGAPRVHSATVVAGA